MCCFLAQFFVTAQLGVAAVGKLTGWKRGIVGLVYQVGSTTYSSKLISAIREDSHPSLDYDIGVGPFTLPFRDGKLSQNVFDHVNNIATLYTHSGVIIDGIRGDATLSIDKNSLRLLSETNYDDNFKAKDSYTSKMVKGSVFGRHSNGVIFKKGNWDPAWMKRIPHLGNVFNEDQWMKDVDKYTSGVEFDQYNGTLYHEGTHALQAGFAGGGFHWTLSYKTYELLEGSNHVYPYNPWEYSARKAAYLMLGIGN